ncbi:MAG TPA: CheR family methyltransferase [Candidatus Hydrogenedentes bacterium]|jgi:chemotaxis methyl-accepting protein methylase|nr:CheR family methyltransferase [Candidatus Hydrogenedentota bacterium]
MHPGSLKKSLHIVGVGASAGGLEAMGELFSRLLPSGRVAYVIAQHMAKGGHSELVARMLIRQSPLSIVVATGGDLLEQDKVYLIPSGSDGEVKNGRIYLLPPSPEHLSTPSVNFLFASIAKDYGKKSIGIILSGAGSDGAAGCRVIKACGGRTFVQKPQSAQYSGMPLAAVKAGAADVEMDIADIARQLTGMFPPSPSVQTAAGPTAASVPSAPVNPYLTTLLQRVFEATGVDFTSYKEETLQRRLERRLAVLKIESVEQYLLYTQQNPLELNILQHLFLVSLSSFFRDSGAFAIVRQHLAELVRQKKQGDTIRIWVPGCASGEECYTFAIILAEILGENFMSFNINILGYDLSPEALAVAREAVYPQTAFKETDSKILKSYFEHKGRHYHVSSSIRSVCEFIKQDVASAKAPENMDVISCRNLLIYMKSNLQDQLFKKFHQALVAQGLLFIGQSENIGLAGNTLFTAIDHYHRLYRRRGV